MAVPIYGIDKELQGKAMSKYSTELEQEAKEWMCTLLKEPSLFPADSTFLQTLKNGQILCRVMNTIQPGAVKTISTSAMPFKQMENINLFLLAAAKAGVPQHDLFQTIDLFEEKNRNAVLDGIFALARSETARAANVPLLGPKLAQRRSVHFTEAQLREAANTPSQQAGFTGGANGAGMSFGAQRQIDAKVGQASAVPSQQSGFTGGANAAGISYGAQRQIVDSHVPIGATDAVSQLTSGYTLGANATGINYGQRRDITMHETQPKEQSQDASVVALQTS